MPWTSTSTGRCRGAASHSAGLSARLQRRLLRAKCVAVARSLHELRPCHSIQRWPSDPVAFTAKHGHITRAVGTSEPAALNIEETVRMAAASFEAYLEPTGGRGFKDTAVNGTTTQYISNAFVQQAFSSVLRVTIRSARNLKPSDPTGRADPYVIVSCGESSHTTAWKFQTLEPVWDETCYLWVPASLPPAQQRIRVSVRDKDFVTSDDDMGLAYVNVGDLSAGGTERRLTVELRGPSAGAGVVELEVDVLALGDASPGVQQVLSAVQDSKPELVDGAPEVAQALSELEEKGLTSLDAGAPIMQRAWATMLDAIGLDALERIERVAYIESLATDTQAWIYRDVPRKQVVVAFRGTEQVKWKDLANDANLVPADLNVEGATADTSLLDKMLRRNVGPTVHSGFLAAFVSVRQRVISVVDAVTGSDESWQVWCTGHSLGGALATLAAYTFASRRKVRNRTVMYNFGSPRVGNAEFVEEYTQLVPDSWRVHNDGDVVAGVPRLIGYAHVPRGVRLHDDGRFTLDDGAWPEGGSGGENGRDEGKSLDEGISKLRERLADPESGMSPSMEAFMRRELELLESLKAGEALAHHMEDVYLESLCAVLERSSMGGTAQSALMEVRNGIRQFRAALSTATTSRDT